MPLEVACSSCGRRLSVPDRLAGKAVKCDGCRAVVRVPAAGRAAPSADVPSAPSEAELPDSLLALLSPPQGADELGRLGRFRVLRLLGVGGMGAVFHAEDSRLKRPVALKVMLPEAAARPQGRARFLREAEAVARLSHDHVIPIHDVGEEGGVPFFVMPLLRGESLQERLARQKPLPVAEAVRIGRQMAEGLAAAHEKGLIHRDVKPANVWLEEPNGRVKLLDFGLARPVEGDAVLTPSGAMLGTPAYMAPEQMGGGKDVDFRADLFSLGAVLYELLTGRRAFPGSTWFEVVANRATTRPSPPRQVNAEVPEELSALVMSLMQQEPAARPASAEDVARRLGKSGPQEALEATANHLREMLLRDLNNVQLRKRYLQVRGPDLRELDEETAQRDYKLVAGVIGGSFMALLGAIGAPIAFLSRDPASAWVFGAVVMAGVLATLGAICGLIIRLFPGRGTRPGWGPAVILVVFGVIFGSCVGGVSGAVGGVVVTLIGQGTTQAVWASIAGAVILGGAFGFFAWGMAGDEGQDKGWGELGPLPYRAYLLGQAEARVRYLQDKSGDNDP
jgi:hypothetical protein